MLKSEMTGGFGRPPPNSTFINNGRNYFSPPFPGAAPVLRHPQWKDDIQILDQDPHSFRSVVDQERYHPPSSAMEQEYSYQPTDFKQSSVFQSPFQHNFSVYNKEINYGQIPEQISSVDDVYYQETGPCIPPLSGLHGLIDMPRPPEPPNFFPCQTPPNLQKSAGNNRSSTPTPPRRYPSDYNSSRSPYKTDYAKYPRKSPDYEYMRYNMPRKSTPDASNYHRQKSPPRRRTSLKKPSSEKRRYSSSSKKSSESRSFSSPKVNTSSRRSFNRTVEKQKSRSKQRSMSSKSSSRNSVDKREKEKKSLSNQNKIESELQEFAKQLDQEALFEKLKQNQLNRLHKQLLDKKTERDAAAAQTELLEQEPESLNEAERNEFDEESDVMEDVYLEEQVENEEMLPVLEKESISSSPDNSEETIIDSYPWYLGAPIQNEIYEAVERAGEDFPEFNGRPQKAEDETACFPIKKRDFVEKSVNEFAKLLPNRIKILKENSDGVVIKRNGSTSWVSRKFIENTSESGSAVQASSSNSQLTVGSPRTNDCYEYGEKKSCKAGLLCQYDHGNGDHRLIKFCKRFMLGLCRNGDECPNGSHALLKHQMPVCDYFLRKTCFLTKEQCPFLHVKTSANTPLCIYFNKGKCLAQPPCTFCHRYSPALIRERCNDVSSATMDYESGSNITKFDDLTPLQWFSSQATHV